MDLRYNNERLRCEIDRATFGVLDNDSQTVKDLKAMMHGHVNKVEEYEDQKKELNRKIKCERAMLKDLAISWDV